MNLTAKTIIAEVASYYNVTRDDIYCIMRKKENVKYKHITMYFMRHFLKQSLALIGGEFPGRRRNGRLDHATVSNALKSVQNQYDTNRIYRKEIDEITQRLKILIQDQKVIEEEVFLENDFYTN